MSDRYPGYDVLAKRDSVSWNDQTRRVIEARMALDPDAHAFFTDAEWPTVAAICRRIAPQPPERPHPAPLAAMVDAKLQADAGDGYPRRALAAAARGLARELFRLSTPRRANTSGSAFPNSMRRSRTLLCRRAARANASPTPGAICRRISSSPNAFCTTWSGPTTPIPPRGTRSASADRRARAAMCG